MLSSLRKRRRSGMTETEWRQRIGDRIRAARQAKELSQEKLADRLGVSFQAVSTWEQGKTIPDTGHLLAMARELELSLDRLFAEEEKMWEMKEINNDAERMYTYVKTRAKEKNLTQALAALPFMREKHRKLIGGEEQVRKSRYGFEAPYEVHPLTLACHALAMKLADDDVIAACLLHDVVEDTETPLDELPVEKGSRVYEAVRLVSRNLYDHSREDWEAAYFAGIRKNPLACLVKCLDRVNNLAGMADGFTHARMIEYTEETDKYYPALLDVLKRTPEYSDAWWLLRYQMTAMTEAFKRLL